MSQCYTTFDLKINLGHSDLYISWSIDFFCSSCEVCCPATAPITCKIHADNMENTQKPLPSPPYHDNNSDFCSYCVLVYTIAFLVNLVIFVMIDRCLMKV